MDCPICFENILPSEITECGHHVHLECLEKQFKAECPLCRRKLNIKITGEKPKNYIQHVVSDNYVVSDEDANDDVDYEDADDEDADDNKEELHFSDYLGDDRNSEGEVCYKECTEDYDEENPHGDEWEYADVEFR